MTTDELKVKISVDTSEVSKKIKEVKQNFNGMGKDVKKETGKASDGFEELHDSMEKVKNLDFASIVSENIDKISASVKKMKQSFNSGFGSLKNARREIADAFNFKNFDVGEDGFKGILQSMKVQFGEAGVSIKKGLSGIGEGFKQMGVMAKAAITSVIGQIALLLGAIAAWVSAIRNAINVSKQIKEMASEAANIGLDVRTYQEWGYVLDSVGVGVDKLSDFLKTLADEQNAVRDGSEDIIKAFNRLGISANEAANMTQGELFRRTVMGLQNIESEVEKTAIAYRIFGEDAANLTSIMNMTNAELEQTVQNFYLLGGAASDSLIQKSNTLQTSINSMKVAWQGLKNTLAEGFMPAITAVIDALTKAIAIINMFIRAIFGFEIVSSGASDTAGGFSSGVGSYTESLGDAAGAAGEATKAIEKLKRTTMGFDELNIVSNPNKDSGGGSSSGGSGGSSSPDYGGGGGGIGGGIGSLADNLDLGKWQEKITAWSDVIRSLVPIAMIGAGAVGAVLFALHGNWIGAIACAALAGFGLVAMTGGEGGFQGYLDTFKNACDGLLAPATFAVGAIGMVIFALTGNWIGAIACGALAGIALMAMEKGEFDPETQMGKFAETCQTVIGPATVALGAIGAVIFALTGNWIGAIACGALAGIALFAMSESEDGIQGSIDKFNSATKGVVGPSLTAIGAIGAVICGLAGNWIGLVGCVAIGALGVYLSKSDGDGDIGGKVDGFTSKIDGITGPALMAIGCIGTVISLLMGNIPMAIACLALTGYGLYLSETNEMDGKISEFSSKVKKITTIAMTAIGVLGCLVCILTGNIPGAIIFGVMGAVGIAGLGDELGWWEAIGEKLKSWWDGLKNWFNEKVKPVFTKEYWKEKWNQIKESTSEKTQEIKEKVSGWWDGIKTWFNEKIKPVFTKQYWKDKWNTLKEGTSEKLNEVKETIGNWWQDKVVGWFNEKLKPVFTKDYWKEKFDTIKDGGKEALNGLIGIVENAINFIVRNLNKISINVPDWVPQIGGRSFGINIPEVSIPRLAKGGIATQSIIANIGENGKEAVLPLENNTGWMDILADKIAERNQTSSRVVLKVGERELGYATIDAINGITKQTGGLKLQLV